MILFHRIAKCEHQGLETCGEPCVHVVSDLHTIGRSHQELLAWGEQIGFGEKKIIWPGTHREHFDVPASIFVEIGAFEDPEHSAITAAMLRRIER